MKNDFYDTDDEIPDNPAIHNHADFSFEMWYDYETNKITFGSSAYAITKDIPYYSQSNLLWMEMVITPKTFDFDFTWADLITKEHVDVVGYNLNLTEEMYFQKSLVYDNVLSFEDMKRLCGFAKDFYNEFIKYKSSDLKGLV